MLLCHVPPQVEQQTKFFESNTASEKGASLTELILSLEVGSGYTIEGQKTGKEDIGGLQIEVTPVYKSDLKIWCRDSNKEPGVFTPLQRLHEQTTPAANNIKPGEKLRVHPVPPVHEVPYNISDLVADLPTLETYITVRFSGVQTTRYTKIWDRLGIQIGNKDDLHSNGRPRR